MSTPPDLRDAYRFNLHPSGIPPIAVLGGVIAGRDSHHHRPVHRAICARHRNLRVRGRRGTHGVPSRAQVPFTWGVSQ